MEIEKILTLSSAHIQGSTADFLDKEDRGVLVVYDKPKYGWFIYVNSEEEAFEEELTLVPQDLANLLTLAKEHDCTWLCLDSDVENEDGLPTFDW